MKQKLILIEALHLGTTHEGEREAAASARERIRERVRRMESTDPPVEYRFTLNDNWTRRLFVALLRRYDIRPYRYSRQRRNTVMVKVSKSFVDKNLWPEFLELSGELTRHLDAVADRIIQGSIHEDNSEAEELKMIGTDGSTDGPA